MLNVTDLQTFCADNQLAVRIIHLPMSTQTVSTAAQALGCSPEQIVKTVLFLVNAQPVITIVNGLGRIDKTAIASHYHFGKKRVRLASSDEVKQYTGYAVGALPPFGHMNVLPTLLDLGVLQQSTIFAGGGSENALIEMSPEMIERAVPVIKLNLLQNTTTG